MFRNRYCIYLLYICFIENILSLNDISEEKTCVSPNFVVLFPGSHLKFLEYYELCHRFSVVIQGKNS